MDRFAKERELNLLNEIDRYSQQADLTNYKRALVALGELYAKESRRAESKAEQQSIDQKFQTVLERLDEIAPKKNKTSSPATEDDGLTDFYSISKPTTKFADVAGLEDVKNEIKRRMILPYENQSLAEAYDVQTGGGVLLYGAPGTGKTTIVRAIAGEVDAKLYEIKSSDIVSKWVGDSERNIKKLFEMVAKEGRVILFFDDMDQLFRKRGENHHNDKSLNEFLQHMDGISGRNKDLLFIGATNIPWDIDDAARRPGRFSKPIFVSLPDEPAREFLFNKFLKKVKVRKALDVSIDTLVARTPEYSGADIEELCSSAKAIAYVEALSLIEQGKIRRDMPIDMFPPIEDRHFVEAQSTILPSVSEETKILLDLFRKKNAFIK